MGDLIHSLMMENSVFNLLIEKGELKQSVYHHTLNVLNYFTVAAKKTVDDFQESFPEQAKSLNVKFQSQKDFCFQLQFAGDVLLFMMHTNVFEFPRTHEVMRTSYIKEDKTRSYCGAIFIFNFLADSFKYERMNDSGYLIGRVFINKDGNYYVEGKKELAQILNNFSNNRFTKETAEEILWSSMKYTLNFDLLVPDFDLMKEVNVGGFLEMESENRLIKTSKRLGFKFQADK